MTNLCTRHYSTGFGPRAKCVRWFMKRHRLKYVQQSLMYVQHPFSNHWIKICAGLCVKYMKMIEHVVALRWRHNGHDSVSNRQPHDCLLNRLFRRRWKKTSKLRVTGLCAGYSTGTGEFLAQRASNAENVSIWWRHHGFNEISTIFLHSDFPHSLLYHCL